MKQSILCITVRLTLVQLALSWAEHVCSSGVHPHQFYRDEVHANEYGEQRLSKILMAFWSNDGSQ